jgi:hypothetical protein
MRLLLALFAFLALGLAPLGRPAVARTAGDHCAEMAGMEHQSPSQNQDHSTGAAVKSCCTAMAAALPAAAAIAETPKLRLPLVAPALPAQLGVRRDVEVPPPRA